VEHADLALDQERIERLLGRVPGHVPAHEVAVANALLEGALAQRGVGDVTRMQKRQLPNLPVVERAALALLGGRSAGVPHEVVGDELPAALECVQQRDRTVRTDQRERRVHLDHRQPAACRGNRVALVGVRLLADPKGVELGLKRRPVDHDREPFACNFHLVDSSRTCPDAYTFRFPR